MFACTVDAGSYRFSELMRALGRMEQLLAQRLGNARLAAVLVRAGYTSVEAVAAAPDEALLAVDGVGDKALAAIRARLG